MPELDLERLFAEMGQREKADKLERYRRLNALAKPGQILLAGSSLMEQFPIHELLQDAGGQPDGVQPGRGGLRHPGVSGRPGRVRAPAAAQAHLPQHRHQRHERPPTTPWRGSSPGTRP